MIRGISKTGFMSGNKLRKVGRIEIYIIGPFIIRHRESNYIPGILVKLPPEREVANVTYCRDKLCFTKLRDDTC